MTFYAQYNRIMRFTFAAVVLIVGGLFFVLFQNREEAELHLIGQRLKERALSLDYTLKTSTDYVDALQMQARTYFVVNRRPGPPSVLYDHFVASRADGIFNLEQPPLPYTREMVGAITAAVRDPDAAFLHEVEMAFSLNPLFAAIRHSLPNAAWVYYTSQKDFINIYPWVSTRDFRFSREVYTHSFYSGGLPQANPRRKRFWTESYVDEAGKGLMVTCAAPVYEDDSFRGTVAIDLTLDVLNRFVANFDSVAGTGGNFGNHLDTLYDFFEDFDYPRGVLFVVNDRGELLAHPRLVSSADKAVKKLDVALPADLGQPAREVIAAGANTMTPVGRYYVSSTSLDHAPWKLVFVAPRTGIAIQIIQGPGLLMAAMLFGLTAMLAIATRTTRRHFVQPALSLVNHIELESKALTSPVPDVPAAWQPWFETITHIFNEHSQLVSIRQELDIARRMQQAILPTRFPARDDFQLFARMIPAKEVGGDFYDYFWLDERHLGIVIAAVSGKGVPAALFMAVARTLVRAVAPAAASPGACLETCNSLLAGDNDQNMFVTTFYGILDTVSGEFAYANGGHNPPYLIDPDGAVTALPGTDGVALGVVEGLAYKQATITLAPGATLFLFTDGVTESFDAGLVQFTEDRLVPVLRTAAGQDVHGIVDTVVGAVETFAAGAAQADDITCLALCFARTRPGG